MNDAIVFENGKYEFLIDAHNNLICNRYGQPWREFIGDKAVYCLFMECLRVKQVLNDNLENSQ